jgi:DNA polymerase-3 subunit delta
MDALAFLDRAPHSKPQPVYVLCGDDDFLKRQALDAVKALILGPEDPGFGLSSVAGDKTDFAAVRDELATLPFLGPHRLVVVDNADPFVTRHRAALEKYVAECHGQLAARATPTGVLVLDVKSWPANTRLAKAIPDAGTITCKAPAAHRLPQWCQQWASARHGKQLSAPAAQLLVELVGPEMGQLDQELEKLAVYVGAASRIDQSDVDQLVGRSRAADTFKIFDALGNGKPGEALAVLDQLLVQGEEPLRILGAFSWQLRRLAQVARIARQTRSLPAAMDQAGIEPYAQRRYEQQLRHLGRRRAEQLYDWLLEADLGMKGSSALPPRTILERLLVKMA